MLEQCQFITNCNSVSKPSFPFWHRYVDRIGADFLKVKCKVLICFFLPALAALENLLLNAANHFLIVGKKSGHQSNLYFLTTPLIVLAAMVNTYTVPDIQIIELDRLLIPSRAKSVTGRHWKYCKSHRRVTKLA